MAREHAVICKQCVARRAGYLWYDLVYCQVCRRDHAARTVVQPYRARDIYGYGQD